MFTLVPGDFFEPSKAGQCLRDVAEFPEGDEVRFVELPQYGAVLIYNVSGNEAEDFRPEMFYVLEALNSCREYNKIVISCDGSFLYLAIAQGKTLLLSNAFPASDFTTAQYYLFMAMKSLQLNPEISVVCWRSGLSADDEMSLYRYFKSVEKI